MKEVSICAGAESLGIFSDASVQDPICQQDRGN